MVSFRGRDLSRKYVKYSLALFLLITFSFFCYILFFRKKRRPKYSKHVKDPSIFIKDPSSFNIPEDIRYAIDNLIGTEPWNWPKPPENAFKILKSYDTHDYIEDHLGFRYDYHKGACGLGDTIYSKFHFWRATLWLWREYTKRLDIEWYPYDGSLIHATRGFFPYDFDVDILINRDDLHKLQAGFPDDLLGKWFLHVNPQHVRKDLVKEERTVYDCYYSPDIVEPQRCGNNNLIGRLMHRKGWETVIDMYSFTRDEGKKEIVIEDTMWEGGKKSFYFSQFEHVPCTLYGLEVYCPKESAELLAQIYGKDWNLPDVVCKTDIGWVNRITGEKA